MNSKLFFCSAGDLHLKQLLILCILLLLMTGCSSSHVRTDIEDRMNREPVFKTGFAGLMIYDPAKKKVLYNRNADKYFTPASNIKLLTFYTGIKMLGDSVPALYYVTKNDSLIFWATGDPSFLHRDFPYSHTLAFLKSRKENLFYAAPRQEDSRFGPGWAWEDYNYSYSAERAALPISGNVVSFTTMDSGLTASPRFFQQFIFQDRELKSKRITRNVQENNFRHNLPNKKGYEQQVPFKYSSSLAVTLLADTLQREITVLENFPRPKEYEVLHSISADSLYKKMLQESDNFIAEQILLLSAGRHSDSLLASVAIDHMKERYLKDLPQEVKWVDGSGLSRYNLVTPHSMVALLEKLWLEVPEQRLFDLFATGGVSGTLKNSYKGKSPYLFAKTGTLGNVHNLSGYLLTAKGEILIFSFMNNNFMVPTRLIKGEMENILNKVHRNY